MAPNLRQPESLATLCNRAMILYMWLLAKKLMSIVKPTNKRKRTRAKSSTPVAIAPSCVAFLQSYFECRIPPRAYDGLRDELMKFIVNFVYRKCVEPNDKREKSFLREFRVYAPVWWTMILSHCHVLHFGVYQKKIFQVFWGGLDRMTGLQSIDFKHVWERSDASTIARCIAHWPELRHFGQEDCVDSILLALSDSCPKLRSLHVSYSEDITDDSVQILLKFRELKDLQIKKTSITSDGFRQLMDGLRLERLDTCDEWLMDLPLEQYRNGETFALTHFKGGRYWTSSSDQLRFLSTHCPNLWFISIIPWIGFVGLCDLTHLCAIDKLSTLSIGSFQFHTHKIHDVLQVKGANLVYLKLDQVGEMDTQGLIFISKYCPNLEELILKSLSVDDTPWHNVDRVEHPFQNLKHLSVDGEPRFHHLEYLLGNCFNIVRIHIWTYSLILTDSDIDRILAMNPLQHVRTIDINGRASNLTIVTAHRLLEACPELTKLGTLLKWNIKPDEHELLESYLREHNFAVKLGSDSGSTQVWCVNGFITE